MTLRQVAARLRVSRQYAYRQAVTGRLVITYRGRDAKGDGIRVSRESVERLRLERIAVAAERLRRAGGLE